MTSAAHSLRFLFWFEPTQADVSRVGEASEGVVGAGGGGGHSRSRRSRRSPLSAHPIPGPPKSCVRRVLPNGGTPEIREVDRRLLQRLFQRIRSP